MQHDRASIARYPRREIPALPLSRLPRSECEVHRPYPVCLWSMVCGFLPGNLAVSVVNQFFPTPSFFSPPLLMYIAGTEWHLTDAPKNLEKWAFLAWVAASLSKVVLPCRVDLSSGSLLHHHSISVVIYHLHHSFFRHIFIWIAEM